MNKNHAVENHDALILGPNHYLLSDYVAQTVNNIPQGLEQSPIGARIVASVLQEVKNGQIWTWQSSDFPEFHVMSVQGRDYGNQNPKYADYMHFNSVIIDPKDQNLITSFRH